MKIGLDNGRAVGRRPGIGEAPLDIVLVQRGVEAIDRQTIAGDRDVATRAQCPHAGRSCVAMSAEPREQHVGVGGFHCAGPGECETVCGLLELAVQAHLSLPRRA